MQNVKFWVEQNIILFKNNVMKVMLGHKTIFYRPECKKVCLDDVEIEAENENVVCYDKCGFTRVVLVSLH